MRPTIKISSRALIFLYIILRLLSFATYFHPIANQIIAVLLIGSFGYICLKDLKFGWLLLVGELILDGAGHFFELHNLLLRTWFLGIFGLAWVITKIKQKDNLILPKRKIAIGLMGMGIVVAGSVIRGFIFHHATLNILQDAILYCFFFLLFPALEFKQVTKEPLLTYLKAWMIGSTIFSLITFFIYSSGVGHLSDTYYHWFRNIAAGKITDLGNHFFRIVLPEHIFIVPIILVLAAYLINNPKNKKLWAWIMSCLFVLVLNFTRIYFLALFVGLVILAIKQPLKRWFLVSTITVTSILIIFSSTYLIASRGQSIGLELLGVRVNGSTAPQTDTSGAIRLAMLPDIFRSIKAHSWFGSGLGATVKYNDPTTHEQVIRTQFDWGYFELVAELGIIGTSIFLLFIGTIIYSLVRLSYFSKGDLNIDTPLTRGLLAGMVSLCVMNITTPALFQGFGVLFMILAMVLV